MTKNSHDKVLKLALTALFAALCYVIFTYLQIKIPMPGGDAASCIWEMPSVCWQLCCWADGTAAWPVLWA